MTAESSPTLLLAVLVLGIFGDHCKAQELRCQCIQMHSDFISPQFIETLQLIPEGVQCSRKEVIVTLKNGQLVCLDPEVKWVKSLLEKVH